jgi:hypothetical protein
MDGLEYRLRFLAASGQNFSSSYLWILNVSMEIIQCLLLSLFICGCLLLESYSTTIAQKFKLSDLRLKLREKTNFIYYGATIAPLPTIYASKHASKQFSAITTLKTYHDRHLSA